MRASGGTRHPAGLVRAGSARGLGTVSAAGSPSRLASPCLLVLLALAGSLITAIPDSALAAAKKRAPRPTPVQVAAGLRHACVLKSDGTVRCWGENASGQLGTGDRLDRATATPVKGALGMRQVSVGGNHSCAITKSLSVNCWGSNVFGELGTGRSGGSLSRVAVALPRGTLAKQVSAGDFHTCLLTTRGRVLCFGHNDHGQLGNGGSADSNRPVAVTGLSNVRQIAAGRRHVCALLASGTVRCWGEGRSGQLGNGGTSDRGKAVAVVRIKKVKAIAAGWDSTCAAVSDGSVRCWGEAMFGQLGNGSRARSASPVAVSGLTRRNPVQRLAVGWNVACAILRSGAVHCWGSSEFGAVGDGSQYQLRLTPVVVRGLSKAAAISAGVGHTCAIAAGVTRCWGLNDFGELGDNTFTTRLSPVAVKGVVP